MDPLVEPIIDGLRLVCLVEVVGTLPGDDASLEGQLGQLVSYDSAADKLGILLISGRALDLEPKCVRAPEVVRKPGQGGGPQSFDVLLGPRTPDAVLAEELAACLFEKGFCVLRLCQSLTGLESAVEAVRTMGDEGRLGRLPYEVEEGYLGIGGRGKVFWMDRDALAGGEQTEALRSNDQTFSYLASLIQPYSADAVGKLIEERTPALVSLSLMDVEEDDYPQPMADDRTLGDFLGTWRRGAVRTVHFMGPATAEVVLECRETPEAAELPRVNERLVIEASPNTVVLFRPDCFSLESRAQGEVLTMMASFLTQAPQFYLTGLDGDMRALRGLADGPAPPSGDVVSVMHHHTRLAAHWDDSSMFFSGMQAGTDAVVEIPIVRFDLEVYWCPNPDELLSGPPRTVQRHTSYVDGVDLFDYKYFEISRNEATGMDPLQRQVLDVGGNLLSMFGIAKKDTNRKSHHAGCAVGVDKDDYPTLPNAQGGCNATAIIANRFSFVFNMKGPNYVCDTACSASLTATHVAKMMLHERSWDPLEFHLAIGTHLCLSPAPWIGCSYSQMVSPEGRCFTFNASANGYLRGEGTSGILLKFGDAEDRDAVLRASSLGQDGRSASLTAPNGPSQEEMIWRAIREARMTPPETSSWECHGTGTSLGDPIEVGAVRRVQLKATRTEPLMLSTAKTNIGHLEGGAAMGGIVRCIREVMHSNCFPTNHARQLNAHLEGHAFDAFFATELVTSRHDQSHAQVSSFGFGGSNGHAIFWGRRGSERLDVETQVLRRLARMRPAEVRPIGDDPADWEADLPDADAKPGDRWMICFSPDDPPDAPIKWVKDYAVDGGVEDEEDTMFAITGNFNGWATEAMDAGDQVAGQFVATAAVPASGALEFRFLKNADPAQVICPASPLCTRKSAPIYGPGDKLSNAWVISAEPRSTFRIELMAIGGQYAVVWLRA